MPVASAAAAPPEDPPAVFDRSYGLRVVPKTSLKVWPPAANSGMFVLPRVITPARFIRSITRSSVSGTKSARLGEPKVVRIPAVRWLSLCATGSPCSGPANSPRAASSSCAAACSSACSAVSVTIALTRGLSSSTRSRWALTTSRALTCLARSIAASSVAER